MYRSSGELQGPDGSGAAHSPGWTQRAPHRLQEGEETPPLNPADTDTIDYIY